VAHGSLAELQTQIEIAMRLGYIAPDCGGELLDDASALSRQLHALRASLSARLEKSRLPTAKVNSSAKSQPPTPNPDVP
jgi:hypothetical protein